MQVIVAASVTKTTLLADNLPRRLVAACIWDEEGYLCLWDVGILILLGKTSYSSKLFYTSSSVLAYPILQH
jgi:hypothetical protein